MVVEGDAVPGSGASSETIARPRAFVGDDAALPGASDGGRRFAYETCWEMRHDAYETSYDMRQLDGERSYDGGRVDGERSYGGRGFDRGWSGRAIDFP